MAAPPRARARALAPSWEEPVPLINQVSLRNLLLRQLAPADFALLAPHLEPVELRTGEVLSEPGQLCEHAFFFEQGLGSIAPFSPEGQVGASGLFGRDGFGPVSLALEVDRPCYRIVVQVPGLGHRVPAQALREAIAASPPLHGLLLRYAYALSIQTAYTALSNAVHTNEERLARWLLMSHDRVDGDAIALTREALSLMLAERWPGVITALHGLESSGLVRSEPDGVVIIDRPGLEAFAADAYGLSEAEYARLLGPLR